MADLSLPRSWQLLMDALWHQQWPTTNEDWVLLLQTADGHYLTGALALLVADVSSIPTEVARYLRVARYESEARYARAQTLVSDLGTLLELHRQQAILFKGFVLAQFYPYPPARFFSDIDLLLPGDEAEQHFVAVLLDRGYTTASDVQPGESFVHYPKLFPPQRGMSVEVHRMLGQEGGFNRPERIAEVWQRARPCVNFPSFLTLDPVDHYLYLIYHAVYAHLLEVGLRAFYDLFWLTRDWDAACWREVVARATAWEILPTLRLGWGLQCWVERRAWSNHPGAAYLDPPPVEALEAAQRVMLQQASTELQRIWRAKREPGIRGWLGYVKLTVTMDGTLPWYRWPARVFELARRLLRSLWTLIRRGDPVLNSYRRLLLWLREGR